MTELELFMQCGKQIRVPESQTHLERLVNVFGAILVRLFGRKFRLLKLQKLTPENLQLGKGVNNYLNYVSIR